MAGSGAGPGDPPPTWPLSRVARRYFRHLAASISGPDWPCRVEGDVLIEGLDRGERDAILLALRLNADLVLMDEREGVDEARRLGLLVTGTLGVLDRAAEGGLIELAPAIARLRETNFRIDPVVLQRLLDGDARRRKPTDND